MEKSDLRLFMMDLLFQVNKQTESEWNIPADDQSVTPSKVSSSLGKSPKTAKKVVKQLEKQPNGSFMASPEEECPSPRTKRSAKKISLEVPNDPQVRPRWNGIALT